MTTKQQTPQLRFTGFSEDWVQKKLVDEVNFFSGLTYTPNDVVDKSGTLVLRSSNVQNGAIALGDNVYVKSEVVNSQNVEVGDSIVVVRNGSRNLIGKHAMITKPMSKTVIGAFMTGIRAPIPSFFNTLLDTQEFNDEVSKNLGATINQITGGMFKAMSFYLPQSDEQTAIGNLFQNIDQTITLQRRKHQQTQTLKKSLLSKMFPKKGQVQPEIRLEGFSGDWVEKKLTDEVTFFSGLTYTPNDVIDKSGTLVLRSSNVQNGYIALNDNVYVNSKVVNSQNVKVGDIIVVVRNGSRNLIGKHAMIIKPMSNTVIGAFMTGIRAPAPSFFNALLDTQEFNDEVSKNLGATINQITGGMFKKMEFYIPKHEEQTAIGQFFKQLDDTLSLQAQRLKILDNLKKALLAKMFV